MISSLSSSGDSGSLALEVLAIKGFVVKTGKGEVRFQSPGGMTTFFESNSRIKPLRVPPWPHYKRRLTLWVNNIIKSKSAAAASLTSIV